MRLSWLAISIIAILLLVSSVGAFSGSGAGTSGDPYQITTYSQLNEIRNAPNSYYKLMNDIDCSGNTWATIDTYNDATGSVHFDGDYHVIKNLYYSATISSGTGIYQGMWNYVWGGGEIENVIFYNGSMVLSNPLGSTVVYTGFLTGRLADYVNVSNVFFDRCSMRIDYSGTNPGSEYDSLGFVTGRVTTDGVYITNIAIFNSTFTHTGDSGDGGHRTYAGGVFGGYKAINSYIYSDVSVNMEGYGLSYQNGLFGAQSSNSVTSCYYVNDTANAFTTPVDATAITNSMAQVEGTFVDWDFDNLWTMGNSTWHGYPVFDSNDWFGTNVIAPVAAFSANVTSGASPLAVGFTDASTNTPTDWDWYWGADETKSSDDQNPTHQFTTGTYNIRLWASNSAGGDWENKTTYITSGDIPTSAFSANVTSGATPLNVGFTDSSTNTPTNWDWYWGADETKSSDDQNPTHQFTTGTYNIRLYTSNLLGGDWENKTAYIVVGLPPTASFTRAPTTASVDGVSTVFTDTSTGATSWNWSFGDGTYSNLQNPTHQYLVGGGVTSQKWTVVLTVTNSFGSDSKTWVDCVIRYKVPYAQFSMANNAGLAPLNVTFNDLSQNCTLICYDWTNDGTCDGSEVVPGTTIYHVFATPGLYTIQQRGRNGYTSDYEIKTNAVTVYGNISISFTKNQTSGDAPLSVQFTGSDAGGSLIADEWYWVFGDGETSDLKSPVHTFDTAGVYAVNVTGTNTTFSDSFTTATQNVTVIFESEFYGAPTTLNEEESVHFTDNSLGSPTGWYWDFGDGQYSTSQNPFHSYSGYSITYFKLFNVSLTITKAGATNATLTKTDYINVSQTTPEALNPPVNVTSGTGYCPPNLVVAFTGQYNPGYPDSVDWYFNGTHSTSWNPVVTFTTPGVYPVNYSYVNEMGRGNWYNFTYSILGHPPHTSGVSTNVTSGLVYAPTGVNIHQLGYDTFWNGSYWGVPTSWTWDFGDGTVATTTVGSVDHTYSTGGTYNITMTSSNLWGVGNTDTMSFVVLPVPPASAIRWIDEAGNTVTSVYYGKNVTYQFDTMGDGEIGSVPTIVYKLDKYRFEFYQQDISTGNWLFQNLNETYAARQYGVATPYYYGALYTTPGWLFYSWRWTGYGIIRDYDSTQNVQVRMIADNTTNSTAYPSVTLGTASLSVINNPLLVSNVGTTATAVGGTPFNLVIAAIIVIIFIAIPYIVTRVFNLYIEIFAAILAIGLSYFAGLIDIWVIVGMGVIAGVIIFFMNWQGGGGSEGGSEGGEVG